MTLHQITWGWVYNVHTCEAIHESSAERIAGFCFVVAKYVEYIVARPSDILRIVAVNIELAIHNRAICHDVTSLQGERQGRHAYHSVFVVE